MISPRAMKRSRRHSRSISRPAAPATYAVPEALRLSEPAQLLPQWQMGPDGLECRWRLSSQPPS